MSVVRPGDSKVGVYDKYVVFKRDFAEKSGILNLYASDVIKGEYFVIRQSDIFAPAVLYAYAHLIQTSVELANTKRVSLFTSKEYRDLLALADDLVEMAARWQGDLAFRKVPD